MLENVVSMRSARTWRNGPAAAVTSTRQSMPRAAKRATISPRSWCRRGSADGMVSQSRPPSIAARYWAGHGWVGSASIASMSCRGA